MSTSHAVPYVIPAAPADQPLLPAPFQQARHLALVAAPANDAEPSTPIWSAAAMRMDSAIPTSSEVLRQPTIAVESEIEARIIALLERPLPCGLTHAAGHDAKERELLALLAPLPPTTALAIRRRVEGTATDTLRTAFARMVPERQDRVIAFLAGAPRRAAMARR
jgi:hypothetical protein